jgi:hypothetical protein
MNTNTFRVWGVFYLSAALLALLGVGIISIQLIASFADAATPTKIVVARVIEPNTYFSGTRANVDAGITAGGAQTANPATFTNILAGSHTVSVTKKYSSLTLKNFKMCTSIDITTSCTPTTPVSFSCTDTQCTTTKITVGSRPVRVQAQYGRVY